jgi:hypothetical protein
MKINLQNLRRIAIATAFASGIVSAGVAASAQTTATPATTTVNATNVSMSSTGDAKARRQVELEAINADARRTEFLHQGTSL